MFEATAAWCSLPTRRLRSGPLSVRADGCRGGVQALALQLARRAGSVPLTLERQKPESEEEEARRLEAERREAESEGESESGDESVPGTVASVAATMPEYHGCSACSSS